MSRSPTVSGDINAYEFYVEMALHFHCADCGERMECPVADTDVEAPWPPWATRQGRRGMSAGWWVPPLTENGSVRLIAYCPSCGEGEGW